MKKEFSTRTQAHNALRERRKQYEEAEREFDQALAIIDKLVDPKPDDKNAKRIQHKD
jgi:hypothetical protein